jgi:hypothetical protein
MPTGAAKIFPSHWRYGPDILLGRRRPRGEIVAFGFHRTQTRLRSCAPGIDVDDAMTGNWLTK